MQNSNARNKVNQVLRDIEDAYAPNTIRAYRADIHDFMNFCESANFEALPADPLAVSHYVAYLADSGQRTSTILRKVASISAVHRYSYFSDPTKHPECKIAIRKISRRLGTRCQQAQPINKEILEQMLATCRDDLRGIRNELLLKLAYDTLRRRSESVSLRIDDWIEKGDGTSTILLRQSKTDQTAVGIPLKLSKQTTDIIKRWISVSNLSSGYLIRGLNVKEITESLSAGHATKIRLPLVKRRLTNPVASTDIGCSLTSFLFLQGLDDLFFTKSLLNKSFLSRSDSTGNWRSLRGQVSTSKISFRCSGSDNYQRQQSINRVLSPKQFDDNYLRKLEGV